MRYRKLTATGDMAYGQGNQDFHVDNEAVRQAIQTRLQLYKGAFWRDLNEGLPLFQSILGASGSQSNLDSIDNIIRQRVLGTQGVRSVVSLNSSFETEARQYLFTATVQTIYSTTVIVTGVL